MLRANETIGRFVYCHRHIVVACWLIGAALLWTTVPKIDPFTHNEVSLLPESAPSRQAVQAIRKHFPDGSSLSEAVIVFERRDGLLSADDMQIIESLTARIRQPSKLAGQKELAGISVRSPATVALPNNPLTGEPIGRNLLVSLDGNGQAAIVQVAIPSSFIAVQSNLIVRHIRSILESLSLPPGLHVAVTGSAGFGHDYAAAAEDSHRSTMRVTLAAVIVILLLVYRSPVAAALPLGAISLAAVVTVKTLDLADHFGLHTGTAEAIFVFVLLYGAGVDYSLLLISRFREKMSQGASAEDSAREGLARSFWAIFATAAINSAGLLMLVFADYGAFRTAGPAVAIAIAIACLASVTLTPAMVGILGKRTFWPRRVAPATCATDAAVANSVTTAPDKRKGLRIWPAIAKLITVRPGLTMIVTVAVLAIPAIQTTRLHLVYDTLAGIKGSQIYGVGNAAEGLEMAKRHWPVGQVSPVSVLIESPSPLSHQQWEDISRQVGLALVNLAGVSDVRSLDWPLGSTTPATVTALAKTVGAAKINREYLAADASATRLVVAMNQPALTLAAMATLNEIRKTVQSAASTAVSAHVYIAGATAEMADIRATTQRDFYRIAVLVLGVILLIVVALLRDLLLSVFMVAATILGYLATLGLADWVFVGLLGSSGLDWKVEVFLFVVLVAVGGDYNIFLAARLAQEARTTPPRRAVRAALVHTGPVISSCGLIMAATLGSLMSGSLQLLQQLGFALALGMLIDTFIVRPLILPAFVALTGRVGGGSLSQ